MNTIESLGFIGLGVMGEAMCANLTAKSGKAVHGFDVRAEPVARLSAKGLRVCGSIADVARAADAIFLSLPTGADVEKVCFGPGGIVTAGGRARIVVDTGTSPVKLTRELAQKLASHGLAFADAPVARTRQAARDGTLSIMVGASEELFEALRPLLACMGTEISHCGGVGNGQVVKILNNMVVFMTVQALAEALAIGRRAGIDGKLLFDVMAKGSSDSFVLRSHGLKSLVPGAFPEDAFPTDYALKDIKLALELAAQGGVTARGAQTTHDLLTATSKAGFGRAYHPSMIKLIEKG